MSRGVTYNIYCDGSDSKNGQVCKNVAVPKTDSVCSACKGNFRGQKSISQLALYK